MMMDAIWSVGPLNAPKMPGFGSVGCPDSVISEVSEDITDDEIEGMINGLGFFEDHDDIALSAKTDTIQCSITPASTTNIDRPQQTSTAEVDDAPAKSKCVTVSPVHFPIITDDTGAVLSIPALTISNTLDADGSLNISESKEFGIGLPYPPQQMTPTCVDNIQTVLDQQFETIMKNQQIIEAQKSELQGQKSQTPSGQPPIRNISVPTPNATLSAKSSACYSLAHAALKKADEQVIDGSNGKTVTVKSGTKRKANSQSSAAEANAYQKWKLTPEGATKLRAVDLGGGLEIGRSNFIGKLQDDPSGKCLSPGELEVRRERNRKHAKKSRLRKKSLTSTLEQSLEALREENTMLRKRIEDYIAAKKKKEEGNDVSSAVAEATEGKNVNKLLEDHCLRSHEKFIASILANDARHRVKKSTKKKSPCKEATAGSSGDKKNTSDDEKSVVSTQDQNPPAIITGRGIVLDEKTLKVMKGLSKSLTISTATSSGKGGKKIN